jgi:hypothetical protein
MSETISTQAHESEPMFTLPYTVHFTIEGVAPILFHAWSNTAVAAQIAAKKGSAAKKTDNIESYVYRDAGGDLILPGVNLKGVVVDPRNGAAKYLQDPRSPRKSALDLFRAAIIVDDAALWNYTGERAHTWDFLDERRVVVQRAGVTRVRPALATGWRAQFVVTVISPEYVSQPMLREVFTRGGSLVGVGDFRPQFGRFDIVNVEADFR